MSTISEMITTRETDTKMALCDECGGLGEYETQHPMWGSPFCPEAYVIVKCGACEGTGEVEVEDEPDAEMQERML